MPTFNFCPQCASPLEVAPVQNHSRLVCAARCGFVHWDNPIPVVAAIVEYENDTLILIQNKGWPAEWFGLVSGFLEKGENPDEAVLREVKEELGLDAQLIESLGVFSFNQRNELILAYHVKASGPIVMDPNELEAYKIIPIHEARPWPFGTGIALKKWLKKRKEG
ncbi:NUDIX domain-containing protein [Runella limosa]|uniref:NUDIX domain-containing protein n=1 Tax=Runella limosa TaxID=370978 RepID=UPI00048D698E|nr:NUDIX domain-containing protein [Runella limosa]